MCAALANVEEDNWEWHTFDTVKGGDYLVDQDAAEIMCREAIDAVLDLEKMGLPFNRTPDGRIDQRRFGGHTRNHGEAAVRRSCYAADRTGHMILQTLYQNCVKQGVEFFNEFYVLDLLLTDDEPEHQRAAGVVAYELATGEIHVFAAKAVVVATGGFGKGLQDDLERAHSHRRRHGIVWRKGLPLEDMEFFQFHPTGLAGLGILLSEAARGEGAILRNADGERFMERYAPTIKDLAPRDIVARSMAQRGARGPRRRSEQGLRAARPDPPAAGADRRQAARTSPSSPAPTSGSSPMTEPVPVYPDGALRDGRHAHHGSRRGAARQHRRPSPACTRPARCACVSVHGSNRLGTNSLLDINVFGRRAGLAAAQHAAAVPQPELPTGSESFVTELVQALLTSSRLRTGRHDPSRAAAHAWTATLRCTGPKSRSSKPRRTSRLSRSAIANVAVTDKGKRFNTDLLEAIELGFLLDLAEVLVVSARARDRVARWPLPRGLPGPGRRQLHAPHHGLSRARAAAVRLDYQPVVQTRYRADGSEVLTWRLTRYSRRAPPPRTITVRIRRYDPEQDAAPHWQSYDVAAQPTELVLDLLHTIKWELDGSLTFRRSCAPRSLRLGRDAHQRRESPGLQGSGARSARTKITIEPIKGLPLLKDLVVDMEPFFEAYRAVHAVPDHLRESSRRASASSPRRTGIATTTRPSASCALPAPPHARSTGPTAQYVGPAAIVNAHRFIFDSRDEGADERLEILNDREGVWRCRTTFNCTDACPRGIEVTKAIQEVKRALLYRRV